MKLDLFSYHLPRERIAQKPASPRDHSRLLVLRRNTKTIEEARFIHLPRFLAPGDLLVINDTKVLPLRIKGRKTTGGAAELTFVAPPSGRREAEGLLKAKNPRPGAEILLPQGVKLKIIGTSDAEVRTDPREGAPLWKMEVVEGDLEECLKKHGRLPLPPYIKEQQTKTSRKSESRYQTIYAREGEAAAAATAGLHFTPRLMKKLEKRGVDFARVRLDVSFGTFAPVRAQEIEEHKMYPEFYLVSEQAADKVNAAKARGAKVVAVGTTAVRVLEHCADEKGRLRPGQGWTSLFIYPGYRFKLVDAMITNFHMPRSTLLMLVAAFAGREFVLSAYEYALKNHFRFLSFGDAMLIL